MIKNLKISLILTGAFIIIIIASIVLISAQGKTPKGTDKVEKLISGCKIKSASKVISVIDPSAVGTNEFANSVTVADYFSECNIDFKLGNKDTVKKAYLIGIVEPEDIGGADALEELMSYYSMIGSYRYAVAYIGVDYVDENGNEKSSVADCVITFNDKTGKIYDIN